MLLHFSLVLDIRLWTSQFRGFFFIRVLRTLLWLLEKETRCKTITKLLSSNFKDLHKVLSRTLYTSDFVIYEITSIVPFYADKRALELLVLVMVLAYLLTLLIK